MAKFRNIIGKILKKREERPVVGGLEGARQMDLITELELLELKKKRADRDLNDYLEKIALDEPTKTKKTKKK